MANTKENVVWITGASSGIGKALAYEWVRLGYKVVLSARRKELLEEIVKQKDFINILTIKNDGVTKENTQKLKRDILYSKVARTQYSNKQVHNDATLKLTNIKNNFIG